MLEISNQVNIAHDWDLEGFLAIMDYHIKHNIVIKVDKLLIKERSRIEDGSIDTSLDIDNNFKL